MTREELYRELDDHYPVAKLRRKKTKSAQLAIAAYGSNSRNLSLRDYYAASAMVFFLSLGCDYRKVARECFAAADAMIECREREAYERYKCLLAEQDFEEARRLVDEWMPSERPPQNERPALAVSYGC